MPRASDAGRRQAAYFREFLEQELVETRQRVEDLAASLSAVIARDGAPIAVKRHRRALKTAVADSRKVTDMLDALDHSYPVPATAVAS